jgi:hypothetical protein
VCNVGGCFPLGVGGGGVLYETGDSLEETVTLGAPSISELRLAFDMEDHTAGCSDGATHTWDVFLGSSRIGDYSFTTPSPGGPPRRRHIDETYSFAPIAGSGGTRYTIRLVATSTVCPGGSSWNWFPGGTATGRSP